MTGDSSEVLKVTGTELESTTEDESIVTTDVNGEDNVNILLLVTSTDPVLSLLLLDKRKGVDVNTRVLSAKVVPWGDSSTSVPKVTLSVLELLTSTEDTAMAEEDTRMSEGVKERTMGLVFGVNV